jgi:hypothetical protein
MKLQRTLCVVTAVLVSVVALWFLMTAMPVQGSGQAVQSPAFATSTVRIFTQDSLLRGEPCGAGEQSPPWTVCLYGIVSQVRPSGHISPLNGIPITVTSSDWPTTCPLFRQSVTAATFVHPGQVTPTFGIDISPLGLSFLEPVTVSARIGDNVIERQVVVYPDLKTQNQRFDIRVPEDPPPSIWGYVVNFDLDAGGPVTGAIVTAECKEPVVTTNELVVTATTAFQDFDSLPVYTLTLTQPGTLDACPGKVFTLTASYDGDTDRKVVTLTGEQQVNFVTGWKCDGFNPLPFLGGGPGMPQTGGGHGMPQTGGGQSLPQDDCGPGLPQTGGGHGMPGTSPDMTDMGCFWGYGQVNGEPEPGMLVRLEISGTVYEAKTRYYPGEERPRYGIGVWGRYNISKALMAATGVYSGNVDSQPITVTLDTDLSQRADFSVTTASLQSDLALKMEGPKVALAGGELVYTLHLTNQGRLLADNPLLTLVLTPSVISQSASITPLSLSPLTWALEPLPPGAPSVTLVVTVNLPADVQPGEDVTATARVTTTAPEAFVVNNTAQVVNPIYSSKPDLRVSMIGPPLLKPGSKAMYSIWADNVGWQAAENTTLEVVFPPELDYQAAFTEPASLDPLTWTLGTLPAQMTEPVHVVLTFTVASTASDRTALDVTALISTSTPDRDPLNNTAIATIPTSLDDALTLIVVAPERLAERYGASPILSELYRLAPHHRVRALVLDTRSDLWTTYILMVFRGHVDGVRSNGNASARSAYAPSSPQDQSVLPLDIYDVPAAYEAWDADPGNPHKANRVAIAIKHLIDHYVATYDELEYVLFVGGDDIIPFYRVADQNGTFWHERNYQGKVPPGTVHAALAGGYFLTDDFYTDRIPESPSSPFLADDHPLYLPDLASGRLVETPQEIMTAISTFLAVSGEISLDLAVVGADERLTGDLGQEQRSVLEDAGITVEYTETWGGFYKQFQNQTSGLAWAALHGNHFSIESLYITHILSRERAYSQTVLSTIGCHAGLNVPRPMTYSLLPDLDLAQVLAERGGTFIAPTAYAYASLEGLEYSEALAQELTCRLLEVQTQPLGLALKRAKRAYYARHSSFDHIDEKALLSMTYYGLPMLEVTVPDAPGCPPQGETQSEVIRQAGQTRVIHSLSDLTYTRHTTTSGVYHDYEGQVIAQHGLPIQPKLQVLLTPTLDGQTVRGALLQTVTYYAESKPFDPLIAQSWAMGAQRPLAQAEPPIKFSKWDRSGPFMLGHFEGREPTDTIASLNFVLGAYNEDTKVEQLVKDITVTVYYSDSVDNTSPTIGSFLAYTYTDSGQTSFQVCASDNEAVMQVWATCDDGQGHWQSISLDQSGGGMWKKRIDKVIPRYYIQVVDSSGNVTTGPWREPESPPLGVYLPLILRQ